VRHFPLARVLHAFDAGVSATGYNGFHENLPACLPTVFISNIRGTDDQEARAQWGHDFGYAIRGNQAELHDITSAVKKLQDPAVREKLASKCKELPATTGGAEIAKILFDLATREEAMRPSWLTYNRLKVQDHINRGKRHVLLVGLRRLGYIYRTLHPYLKFNEIKNDAPIWGSQVTAKELHPLIKGNARFEHLIEGASSAYIERRREIAEKAYGNQREVINIKKTPQ
jgi:hypothetical protein